MIDFSYQNDERYHPNDNKSKSSYTDRAFSLPRSTVQQQQQLQQTPQPGYYTQQRRDMKNGSRQSMQSSPDGGIDTPDFYFMPSQRKYSGEVVRVYVDYNKDRKH